MKKSDNRYGFVGWKEFLNSRQEILNEFDRAKGYNKSRPVKTQHGNAGEAAFRKWLSTFLPKKYGVTSGYVIPDVLTGNYLLYHFDVLIYDSINSPILWADDSYDSSEQGRSRAIPANYLYSAFECKASLTAQSARQALEKLAEFNQFKPYLLSKFSCGTVFFELDPSLADDQKLLSNLLPAQPILGYWGGLVMRCSLDNNMSGLLQLLSLPDKKDVPSEINIPIVKSIDDLNIHRNLDGNITIAEQGAGVLAFDGPDKKWHFSKLYGPIIYGDQCGLSLQWSHNSFASFALDILSLLEGKSLEGKSPQEAKYIFGQVFDSIS